MYEILEQRKNGKWLVWYLGRGGRNGRGTIARYFETLKKVYPQKRFHFFELRPVRG